MGELCTLYRNGYTVKCEVLLLRHAVEIGEFVLETITRFLYPGGRQTAQIFFNIPHCWCGRTTSTRSPSFCVTTFSASLTNLTVLLPQSHDCSCYIRRRILAHPPLRLQKHADLRAHDFEHSPELWHQSRLAYLTGVWSWRRYGVNPAIYHWSYMSKMESQTSWTSPSGETFLVVTE